MDYHKKARRTVSLREELARRVVRDEEFYFGGLESVGATRPTIQDGSRMSVTSQPLRTSAILVTCLRIMSPGADLTS